MKSKSLYALVIVFTVASTAFAADRGKDMNLLRKHVAGLETRVGRLEKTVAKLHAEIGGLKSETAKVVPVAVQARSGLTPEELAAITAYLDARGERDSHGCKWGRDASSLTREYERYKYDEAKRRWTARPKFPGWQDTCYNWHPTGKWYSRQLKCTKCGSGWINPNGFTCHGRHPKPLMEQWQFTVALIATDYQKPMQAKAHLWNALQHEELTEPQWDELMVLLDSIEAEAATKAKPPTKTP